MPSSKRILFISNGHGEDTHTAGVIQSLLELCPTIEPAAMSIVGEGKAYRNINVPIIGPTKIMPSGGFTYMNRLLLLKDIQAGLIGLTWQQLQATLKYARGCDFVMATGDTVGQTFAYLTGRPFISFISCLSALYEGHLNLDLLLWHYFKSNRCKAVITRDPYTAENLKSQGLTKVHFGGIPGLDRLKPTGKDLQLKSGLPMIALLPGSRLPEATRNFILQLQFVLEIVKVLPIEKIQFRAALVSSLMSQLDEIAYSQGWQHEQGKLTYSPPGNEPHQPPIAEILCYSDAYSDIVDQCTLVLGMAGLAVDQAVAIGKPIIQVPGCGPQFTYQYAESQTRLLGSSVQTIGTEPATPQILKIAAVRVVETLQDTDYLAACVENGRNRLGPPGASYRIARLVLSYLD
nr:lipid-A-disaccharide synthase-related protein [Gloeothece verrucosa]